MRALGSARGSEGVCAILEDGADDASPIMVPATLF